ncbi:hypothetical protein FCU94_19100 [Vibrio sp. JPW-9-11-11]|uniref:hypothetical protein n=1 Tax=Vibrio sp. JPW-9-11-11 TaxID=1416532 RepID=UPI0015932F53|nr:hypothetical protein [Vibrio sp. JPW-9-11-11]NVD08959.1 hypothetical protein [Vibrio sp. JPW-9-11-11]
MKWYRYLLTITAALLITLPLPSGASHCDAETWNHALKLQQALDTQYNQHAKRFNQFLTFHREQPFLYQEFSRNEIRSFWQSNKQTLHKSMQGQIAASQQVVEAIEQERKTLNPLLDNASTLHQQWRRISQHCQKIDNQSNTIASWNYAQLNKLLIKQIQQLDEKLALLQQRYQNEVRALEDARQ